MQVTLLGKWIVRSGHLEKDSCCVTLPFQDCPNHSAISILVSDSLRLQRRPSQSSSQRLLGQLLIGSRCLGWRWIDYSNFRGSNVPCSGMKIKLIETCLRWSLFLWLAWSGFFWYCDHFTWWPWCCCPCLWSGEPRTNKGSLCFSTLFRTWYYLKNFYCWFTWIRIETLVPVLCYRNFSSIPLFEVHSSSTPPSYPMTRGSGSTCHWERLVL